jgi:TrmH family RNA methyltransferase
VITSRQNAKAKLVRSLLTRARERKSEAAFVAEGVRLVEEAANSGWAVRLLIYAEGLSGRGLELVEALRARRVDIERSSAELLQWLSDTETSQGLLAVIEQQTLPFPEHPDFLLIPDQIRDPGNLGTLLRSAEAAGVQAVLLPPATADAFSPKAVRAGMGAHFRLPIQVMDWAQIRTHAEGLSVLLADTVGTSAWETDLRQPLALIVGGEASGASADAKAFANHSVAIPMRSTTESLNAAVAGSVLMFEVARQRAAASSRPH